MSGDDVVAVAAPILRHRIIVNFTAQSEGITVEDVIKRLVKTAREGIRRRSALSRKRRTTMPMLI